MFAFIYLCWKTRVISSKYKLLMIQWSPFNYNFPFFYVQNDNIISVNKVCIELLIETTKFRIFDVVSDFHFLQILFNILYFLECNLNYNANERKVTKSSCYITFTSFLLCLNSFFFFFISFHLKTLCLYFCVYCCLLIGTGWCS